MFRVVFTSWYYNNLYQLDLFEKKRKWVGGWEDDFICLLNLACTSEKEKRGYGTEACED